MQIIENKWTVLIFIAKSKFAQIGSKLEQIYSLYYTSVDLHLWILLSTLLLLTGSFL